MKANLFLFFLLIWVIFNLKDVAAQQIQSRLNQGAMLEPQGKIINGAGQDLAGYTNYWNVMHSRDKPLMYMTYVGLNSVTSDWTSVLKADLMSHNGLFQIPQIGLSMTVDGNPSAHYEQDVAAGLYDKQITMFIDGLQSLAMPAFVRIGYEFNGTGWNGYLPDTYKLAFQRITNMIRARGLEVATVWDLAMDGVMNYSDYYPGDSYVDWWAINLFDASHLTNANALNFLDAARVHHKPVMIGESTPRGVGVLNGPQSWNNWFAGYFQLIHNYPEIKAFSYINWNWASYSQWSTWGDARLEMNSFVGNAFANEMDSVEYLHASTEHAFRMTLGSTDKIAPQAPGMITVSQTNYPLQLNWSQVTDPSGLSHYIIYKNGALADYTLTVPYPDQNIKAGDVIKYAVSAMDRAGNESPKTPELTVNVPSKINKALNGEFDTGTQNWYLSIYSSGIAATMKIDSSSVISGRNSCNVTITQGTSTDWLIQLWQWLQVHPGLQYKISFKGKAASKKIIRLVVQQGSGAFSEYYSKSHTLTTNVQTFTDSVLINESNLAKIEFFLGTPGQSQVWIDSVSIIESKPTTTAISKIEDINKTLLRCYPNPFHTKTTIEYRVTKQGFVSLKVFNVAGREIATLVNEQKKEGCYSVDWNAYELLDGVYFCKLQDGNSDAIIKMLRFHR